MNRHDSTEFDAQELLAEAGWVRRLAGKLARMEADADDVAQGALTLALQKRPNAAGGLRPWLAAVLQRVSHHRVRAESRRKAREHGSAAERARTSPASDELLIRLETQQLVAAAVGRLPEPYRRVLLLHYYEGSSPRDIALATGTNPSTVRSQLSRGLARVRDDLRHDPRVNTLRRKHALGTLGFLQLASGTATSSTAPVLLSLLAPALGLAACLTIAMTVFHQQGSNRDLEAQPLGESPSRATASPQAQPRAGRSSGERVATRERKPAATHKGAAVRARLVDKHGNPVPGAVLRFHATPPRPGIGNLEARADRDGVATLEIPDELLTVHPDEGPLAFAAWAPGYAEFHRDTRIAPRGVTDLEEMTLWRGGRLRGRVVRANGKPADGAVVLLATEREAVLGELYRRRGPSYHTMRTSAIAGLDGTFVCDGLRPGVARFWVQCDDSLWTLTTGIDIVAGRAQTIEPVTLDAAPERQLVRGRVTTGHGKPCAGAMIAVGQAATSTCRFLTTSSDGTFAFLPRRNGAVLLVARCGSKVSRPEHAHPGTRCELRLGSPPRRTVHVVDPHGQPIADAWVGLELAGKDFVRAFGGNRMTIPGRGWVRTNLSGAANVVFPTTTDRGLDILLVAVGHGLRHGTTRVCAPFPATITVRMPARAREPALPSPVTATETRPPVRRPVVRDTLLRGKIAIDGNPAAGWFVEVRSPEPASKPRAATVRRTGPEGAFQLACPAGTYRMIARGRLASGERIELARTVRVAHPAHEWTCSLTTGALDIDGDLADEERRAVRGDPHDGAHEITSFGTRRKARVPVGTVVLQRRRRGTERWLFVKQARVTKRSAK